MCAALCAASGCIEDLDPKDVVRSPRILDISADHPEINPGGSTTLRVLLAGTSGAPRYRWAACVSADATRNAASITNFGEGNTFAGCYGDGGVLSDFVTLTGETTPTPTLAFRAPAMTGMPGLTGVLGNSQELLDMLSSIFGTRLSPDALTALVNNIGFVIGVAIEVEVDGVTLRGYKRVVVSGNRHPNTNPPPPRVQVNDVWVTVPSGEDGVCAPENGSTIRVPRSLLVGLTPDANEDRWIESYRVLTASGQLVDRRETAFYSWYGSDGRMAQSLTRSPIRNNIWTAPGTPGDRFLWILLRDGHGGTSGCRLTVTVE